MRWRDSLAKPKANSLRYLKRFPTADFKNYFASVLMLRIINEVIIKDKKKTDFMALTNLNKFLSKLI